MEVLKFVLVSGSRLIKSSHSLSRMVDGCDSQSRVEWDTTEKKIEFISATGGGWQWVFSRDFLKMAVFKDGVKFGLFGSLENQFIALLVFYFLLPVMCYWTPLTFWMGDCSKSQIHVYHKKNMYD